MILETLKYFSDIYIKFIILYKMNLLLAVKITKQFKKLATRYFSKGNLFIFNKIGFKC